MSRFIKTSLVALSILAGASMTYAQGMNDNDGSRDGSRIERNDTPDLMEREELDLDRNTTNSIDRCETNSYDEFGNCVVDPDLQ